MKHRVRSMIYSKYAVGAPHKLAKDALTITIIANYISDRATATAAASLFVSGGGSGSRQHTPYIRVVMLVRVTVHC